MIKLSDACLVRAKLLHKERRFYPSSVGKRIYKENSALDFMCYGFPEVDDVVLYLLFIQQYLKDQGK